MNKTINEVQVVNSDQNELDLILQLAENYNHTNQVGKLNRSIAIEGGEHPALYSEITLDPKTIELQDIIALIDSKGSEIHELNIPNRSFKINYHHDLNYQQLIAVTALRGPILVIAGAGTGKTRVITYRVAYLLESDVPAANILLLTFTRKASKEMLGRVQQLLQDSGVQRIAGGTFHAFSNQVLRQNASQLGISPYFTIVDPQDSADIIDLIKVKLGFAQTENAFPKKERIQEIISKAKNCNMTIADVVNEEYTGLVDYLDEIIQLAEGFSRFKTLCNIFDYDDMMEFLRDKLRDNQDFREKLQKQYQYIMVDEYQDTNIVQKEIVDLLSGESGNVMVVGDDAQSIYGFRGANYENILRFPQTYPDCRVIKIEQNYRSNQGLLNFTNALIMASRLCTKKILHSQKTPPILPLVRKLQDQPAEAEYVVSKILEAREKGLPLDQIAVLVRAFWHSGYIEMELKRRSIPYVTVGGLKFNEKRHVKDVISYMRLLLNPMDAVAWNRVLKLLPGLGQKSASAIIDTLLKNKVIDIEQFSNKKFHEPLSQLDKMLGNAAEPTNSVAKAIGIIISYYSPILKSFDPDYPVRLLDLGVLADMAGQYETLEEFLTDFALEPPSQRYDTGVSPVVNEEEDKPMTISTIHSAKGLEWHTVFIPHALDGMIPSSRSIKTLEQLEEERRLFYVACSRAKEELYITMPSYVSNYDGVMTQPCRFLKEIDKATYDFIPETQSGEPDG